MNNGFQQMWAEIKKCGTMHKGWAGSLYADISVSAGGIPYFCTA